MGITIHYHGHLQDRAQLPELVSQLKTACRKLGWPCEEINERLVGSVERLVEEPDPQDENTSSFVSVTEALDDRWQGLVIQPPECEPLFFTFNRAGKLAVYDALFNSPPGTYSVSEILFCKTQFSSADIHIAVCELLRLAQPFMAAWQVSDEGGYWESGDRQELEKRLGAMSELIQRMASEAGRKKLEEILGQEIEGEVEIGKPITHRSPLWREHRGDTTGEN